MFRSQADPIGFNPTQNQGEWGSPQKNPYSLALRATPPMASVDYYASWPYRGRLNYQHRQLFGSPAANSVYAESFGYRGIVPITALPLLNRPYPYQVGMVNAPNIH